mgnify:FL=1
MTETNQNPIQTIYFTADPKENEIRNKKILDALEPVIKPEFFELAVRPRDATIPILQALSDSPRVLFEEFQKFYNPYSHLVLFVSNDLLGEGTVKKPRLAVLKIASNEVSLFFMTRTKEQIYKYVLNGDEVLKTIDTKSLKLHSSYRAQKIHMENDDYEIVSKFFGLYLFLWRSAEFDNWYASEVYETKRLEFWTEPTDEIIVENANVVRKFKGIKGAYYIESKEDIILFNKYKFSSGTYVVLAKDAVKKEENSNEENSEYTESEYSDQYSEYENQCNDPESCY